MAISTWCRHAAAVLACCALASGQEAIRGTVKSGNKPIPGATVTLRQGNQDVSAATDDQGHFSLPISANTPAELRVQMFGFDPLNRPITEADHGKPLNLELTLRRFGMRGAAAANQEQQQQEAPAETSLATTPVISEPSDSSESLLVQGSLSRGLEVRDRPEMGMGMFPGMMPGGEMAGQQPGVAGGPGAGGPGAGGPGGGGGGFGGGGGPGGFGGGGFGGGMRGGGGPGGFGGGPGGPGGRGQMTQEQRERMQRMIRDRMGGDPQVFGNRSRSRNQRLRGGLFLTARNGTLDASPYSLNGQSITKPDYQQWRFGANLGGPLHIPHLFTDDKTFFFLNYSGTLASNPYSNFTTLPNQAERSGDFSAYRGGTTIYDPLNQTPFPGNIIPNNRISSIAQGLLPLVPLPATSAAVQNYSVVTAVPQDSETVSAMVNRTMTRRDRIAVQINWQTRSGANVQPYGWRDDTSGHGGNFDVRWNRTASPGVILSAHARFNMNQTNATPYFAYGQDISGMLGIQGNSREPVNYGPPNLSFTNFGSLTDSAYLSRRIYTFTLGFNSTVVKGHFTTTSGVEVSRNRWNTLTESNARGTLFFGGLATSERVNGLPVQHTGLDFADFLLGLVQQSTLRLGGADTYLRSTQTAAFVSEEIRASKNLSFTLGARYEVWLPFTEKYNRLANIDVNSTFTEAAVVTPYSVGPYTGRFPAGLVNTDWNNISPRLGVAWRPFKNFRTRVGYGIYMDSSAFNRLPSRLSAQPPFATSSTFNTSSEAVLTLSDPFTGPPGVGILNTYAVEKNYRTPYAQSWNVSLEYDFPQHLVLETAYIGTKGTGLVLQRLPNRALPGAPGTSEIRRQIPYAAGFEYDSTDGNSIFNAMQVRLTRRLQRGASFNVQYTFSKSIDNASSIGGSGNVVVQNDSDFAAERGLSNFDRRHVLNLNTFLYSPFGRNGYFLREHTRLSSFLEEWLMTITVSAQTGAPLTAMVLGNVADAAGTGATGSARAEATGLSIFGTTGFFNTAAFTAPAAGQYGNAGRNTIPGPASLVVGGSFGRGFRIGDDNRRRLDLRADIANLFNQVNITGLGTVVNSLTYGLATNAGAMRSITLSARFRF